MNVQGTENLLAAAVNEGVERFVHISSVGVIGADPLRSRVGGRNAICNYVYVEDVAHACLALAEDPKAVGCYPTISPMPVC